jgi:hypothetical protein
VSGETLTLTVGLKIPDNEARSALEAIRVKMGYAERVRDLVREEVWELTVGPDSGETAAPGGARAHAGLTTARASIERIAATTNLFANPNKHSSSLTSGRVSDLELAPDEVAILVSDRESARGDSMAAAVRRLGVRELASARRWVRWRLVLSERPSPEDPGLLKLIEGIAVADAREGGLLCNPHIQEARAVLPWGGENLLAR